MEAGEQAGLVGRVRYEARHETPEGASKTLEARPARSVSLELVDGAGAVLAVSRTDENGFFELPRLRGGEKLVVWARVKNGEHDIAVTLDPDGSTTHKIVVPVSSGVQHLEVLASDSAEGGPAGAFHILDTMLKGLDAAERWTKREMPPVFVYWGRGVTQNWSFYRGERPRGSGRYSFELLGGQRGQQMTSDTDEHDEAIIVHELGHMVMDLLSTDSSMGGRHPPGAYVDPGLAWEEGRVSWFATAVLGSPLYLDTIGVQPQGKLRVNRDYSRVNPGPQGIGSEQTVGEVLWDLADGVEGLEDRDNDGVALGPEGVMQAMMDITSEEGAFPCLSSFLRFLVSSGRLSEVEIKTLLRRTGQPASVFPTSGRQLWPIDLNVPGSAEGSIDGATNPAPSGGPALPLTGYDAVRAYRFQLSSPARVSVILTIEGSGRVADGTDLDLELRDLRARPIAESRTEGAVERMSGLSLPAGWYLIYVRDGGRGNRANFRLSVTSP